MKDVMLDLETLGTRHDAMIIQIGACYFDRMTGEIGETFSACVDPGEFADRFTIDLSTVKWWLGQSEQARTLVIGEGMTMPLVNALSSLAQFLHTPDVLVWSHATFDMPILANAFQTVGMKFPVPFRNARDLRTLMDLARPHGGRSEPASSVNRKGTHHNALDDAIYQAEYAAEAYKNLNARASA